MCGTSGPVKPMYFQVNMAMKILCNVPSLPICVVCMELKYTYCNVFASVKFLYGNDVGK